MANFNIDADKQLTYDAIVIGSGISGGWAAKELCEAGLKTLVLERGKIMDPATDFPNMHKESWDYELRGSLSPEEKKKYYKDQLREVQEKFRVFQMRLQVLESQSGVEHFSMENLDALESFYLNGLENIKKAKLMKKFPGAKVIEKNSSSSKSIWDSIDGEMVQIPKESDVIFSQHVFTPGLSPIKILKDYNS